MMEQYIYDQANGLWYERDGDYYIPCLKLPKTHIGIWGERYLAYIRERKKLLHTKLTINGILYDHRAEKELPDKDALILVYCRSGRRSKIASEELVKLGYTSVKEFGGIIDWPYEVVK